MRLFLVLSLLIGAVGCDYNHVKGSSDPSEDFAAGDQSTPDFKTVERSVVGPRCLNCHSNARGNQGGTNLESLDNLRRLQSRILFRATEKMDMPPAGPLSEPEVRRLKDWYEAGAPDQIIGVGEKPDPSLGNGPPTFAKLRDKIFAKKCQACHSGANPLGNLDLTDLKQTRLAAAAIFNRVILVGDMPVAPYPAMTPRERTFLWNWFNSGMPE